MNHLMHGCSGRRNTSLSLSISIYISSYLIIFRAIPMKTHRKSENVSYLLSSVHSFFLSPSLSFLNSFPPSFFFISCCISISLYIYILPSLPLSLSLFPSFIPSHLPFFSFLFYPAVSFSLPLLILLLLLLPMKLQRISEKRDTRTYLHV